MIAVLCVYAGLVLTFAGIIVILLSVTTRFAAVRRRGVFLMIIGPLILAIGMLLPARERRITMPVSGLDDYIPVYQFHEIHARHIDATPEEVYRSVAAVSASEIRLFQTLTWIRRFGRSGPESILNAPETQPIIDVATRTTFLKLVERPPHEVVIGSLVSAPRGGGRKAAATPEAFKTLQLAGYAKAAMNFRIEAHPDGGSMLTTETRVFATDDRTRRRFAMYWRVIYPGSALIRRQWLAAIERRAEPKALLKPGSR